MIRLAVSGCCGKMGRRIISLCLEDGDFELAGAIEEKSHPAIGKNIGVEIKDNPEIIKDADVLIEFTSPSATMEHLNSVVKYKKAMVIGTTGLDPQQAEEVKQAGANISIVFSPNMSLGVNLVFRLVKEAARKLGRDYKVDIVEAHHIHKKDAPSGTAKRLVQLINQVPDREDDKIDIDSIREGDIVGEHQVRFNSPQDVIVIKHSAKTRDIFARGALEAAKFIAGRKPGLYDMQDVLG